jgi:hypothetical protein
LNLPPYQPPNEHTQPRYDAVRRAEVVCTVRLGNALAVAIHEDSTRRAAFALIADAVDAYHGVIKATAPPSADKDAAVRCLILARGFANDAVVTSATWGDEIGSWCRMQLLAARLQADRAIALADPSQLPEWTP